MTSQTIESLFQELGPVFGKDKEKYRNHVERVYLNCLLADPDPVNEEKYAIAAVFHDIGIWTDHTIDYLGPSIAQAKLYLLQNGKEEWIDEISGMIEWHHKWSSYHGNYEKTIATFRRADWIDVSFGLLSFGLNRKTIRRNRKQVPNKGFHWFLVKKIAKNFFQHPLKPLPMFKR